MITFDELCSSSVAIKADLGQWLLSGLRDPREEFSDTF